MITDSPITSSVTPSRVNSAYCIDYDTDSISGTGYESVSFSFSGTFTANEYYYIYITYKTGTTYQPYAFFTSGSFSATGGGSSTPTYNYYYWRAYDYNTKSPIYEYNSYIEDYDFSTDTSYDLSSTQIPKIDGYEYIGY